ncbi:MAG TPA: adenosine kinase [Bacteroidales bacterium]|nr:adenosine kinase [Bacteroidales bacterium]
MIRLLGMGNALTDVHMSISSEELLAELGLPKGSMQLIDSERFKKIIDRTAVLPKSISCGGSAANTITGAAKLGVPSAFIGKINENDATGSLYQKDMESYQVKALMLRDQEASGQAIAFVTPDGERTFATYLGAAANLQTEELQDDLFKGFDLFYIEGYLVYNQSLILSAVKMARENGLKVSLDLASYNVVEDNLAFLTDLIENYVDIVFANEEEAKALTGLEPEAALDWLASKVEIAVVKNGAKGALAKRGTEKVRVQAIKANCIDTTGAGDLFAAGFIYGLHLGRSLEECTRYGTITAGKVIEVMGPKMSPETWNEILLNL